MVKSMADQLPVQDLPKTKKIVVLSTVGVVIVLSGIAVFVPETRTYVTSAVKTLLELVPMMIK
jgi:hypothetical protein